MSLPDTRQSSAAEAAVPTTPINALLYQLAQSARALAPRRGASKAERGVGISSLYLFASTVVTNGLGYLYWVGAAHMFSVHTVGYVSLLISTMLLVTQVGSMGMGLGLAYVLPGAGDRWSTIVNSVLGAVIFLGGAFALVTVLIGAALHLEIGTVVLSPQFLVAFILSTILWTFGYVLDQVFTVEKATGLVLLRNGFSSAVRLLLLPVLILLGASDAGVGLLGAWGISALLSLIVVFVLFARNNPHGRRLGWKADRRAVTQVLPLALSNHLMMLLYFAPGLLLPLVVTALVSVEANAYFYTTWMVATILFTVPTSTSMSLFAHSAAQQEVTDARLRYVMRLTLIAVVPMAVAVAGAHHLILSLFGRQYAAHSGTLLMELAAASIPMSICSVYISVQRIRRKFRQAFTAALLIPICCLGPAFMVSSRYGLDGLGAVLVGGYGIVALFCLLELRLSSRTRPIRGAEQVDAFRGEAAGMRMAPAFSVDAMRGEAPLPVADNYSMRAAGGPSRLPSQSEMPAPQKRSAERLFGAILPVCTACAAVLWALSLRGMNLSRINDLGLVSVMPPATYLSLAMLTLVFCLALRQKRLPEPLLLLQVLLLILMLYGISAIVEQQPRFPSAWRHVGIIDYIMRNGSLDPSLDAYFSWPGFFVMNTFFLRVAGLHSALPLLTWAPVFFEVLYLGPLYLLLRAASGDKRLVWLGTWFFYLTNSIGQDYFSPQAFAFFLHLALIAVLVYYFGTASRRRLSSVLLKRDPQSPRQSLPAILRHWAYSWLRPASAPDTFAQPGQRAGLLILIMVLFIMDLVSHQLTPFATLASVALLVFFRRCTPRSLPIWMFVALCTWLTYAAVGYISGHAVQLTSQVGAVHSVISRYATARFQGSPQHALVVNARVILTLGIWSLAAAGALRRRLHGWRDGTYILLGIAPFPLLALQSYGGELLLRVYLFALPSAALFMAAFFYTSPRAGRGWRSTTLIFLSSLVLLGGFLLTRYGNERMDLMSTPDVQAVQQLYADAAPGSVLAVLSPNLPWQYTDIELYRQFSLTDLTTTNHLDLIDSADVPALIHLLPRHRNQRVYLILTPSEKAELSLYFGVPTSAVDRFEKAMLASGRFYVIYNRGGAQILLLTPDKGPGASHKSAGTAQSNPDRAGTSRSAYSAKPV